MVPELYTASGKPRRKFSLGEVAILLGALGDPQRRFPSILIAGTNGKGSTASTLASILAVSGVRTGLYTSPHLARVNERIRLNGEEIGDDDFALLFFQVEAAAQNLVSTGVLAQLPSFFEVLTAQAFLYFAQSNTQIAVLEVGMGGRLDATNVVDPLLSIITDISLDHTEWLGSTLGAIAREKAGILRPKGAMITLPQHADVNEVLGEVAGELGVRTVNAAQYMSAAHSGLSGPYEIEALGSMIRVDSPLSGPHQRRNLALSIAAAVELAEKHGYAITPASLCEGIQRTSWPGRLERIVLSGGGWILDVAHNAAGAWALRASLCSLYAAPGKDKPRTLIFSCLRDKPILEMAQILFPVFDQVIFAPIHSPRAASMADLVAAAESVGVAAIVAGSVADAVRLASNNASRGDVVVSGSVYLVGEARSLLLAERDRQP